MTTRVFDANTRVYEVFDAEPAGYDRWNRDEWMKRKFELGSAFPNLPFFIDGDVRLVQASAIQRWTGLIVD